MMKVCLHSVSYSGTVTPDQAILPLEAVMCKAAQLGFDGITLAAKRPHAACKSCGYVRPGLQIRAAEEE